MKTVLLTMAPFAGAAASQAPAHASTHNHHIVVHKQQSSTSPVLEQHVLSPAYSVGTSQLRSSNNYGSTGGPTAGASKKPGTGRKK